MKIRTAMKHGRRRWIVDAGLVEGRRRRFTCDSLAAARRRLKSLERDAALVGRSWAEIPAADRARVVRVLGEMRGAGVSIEEVWRGYMAGRGRGASTVKAVSLDAAIAECVQSKVSGNRRSAYVDSLEAYLKQFAKGRGAMRVDELSLQVVEEWLAARSSPAGRQTWRNRLSAFFAFCLRRGYVLENVIRRTEPVRVESGRPKILSLRGARRVMRAAERLDPEMVPGLALKLFAGIRPREAQRLRWGDVQLDRALVVIDAAAAKKRDVRMVRLPENCVAWLKWAWESGCSGDVGPAARLTLLLIPQVNYRRRMDAIKAAARVPWPHDVLRHTAVSHWYEVHGGVVTSKQMGHSERIMFANYRAMVSPEAAAAFFRIRPCPERLLRLVGG